jgi:hypothetical protein
LIGQERGKFLLHKNFSRLFIAAVWRFHDAVASDAATSPLSTPKGQEVIPVLRKFSGLNFLFEIPVNEVVRRHFITYYDQLIPYMKPSENVCTWCENLWLKILIGVEQILPAAGAESVPPIRGRLAAGPLDACVRPGSVAVAEPEAAPSGGEVGT